MKKNLYLIGVSCLLAGCWSSTDNDAGNAAETASPQLARAVTGVRLLTTDYNYDRICNYLDEGYGRSAFNLGELTDLSVADYQTGCAYTWKDGAVDGSFDGVRPYPSIYHSVYAFNKKYQPKALNETDSIPPKLSQFGPNPQGTASLWPAVSVPDPKPVLPAVVKPAPKFIGTVTRLTPSPYSTRQSEAIASLGDKARWNLTDNTLHLLYLNHIIHVTLKTSGSPDSQRQRAVSLAKVMIDKLEDAAR